MTDYNPFNYHVELDGISVNVMPKAKGELGWSFTPDCAGYAYWLSVALERREDAR